MSAFARARHAIHDGGHSTRRRAKSRQSLPYPDMPPNAHLLVTTSGAIYAIDAQGVRTVFTSSKNGIVAAKASKDGSGLLAVADAHTVILHDCHSTRNSSWGLSNYHNLQDNDQEHLGGPSRLLEYSQDARSLFLSTSLTGAIQCYSVHSTAVAKVGLDLPVLSVVLAVNTPGQLMISATTRPRPIIHLQNLALHTPALSLCPTASNAAAAVAAFHPERDTVFMLGFCDGTLSIYDAARLARRTGARMDGNASRDLSGKAAELAVFKGLHRRTTSGQPEQEREESPGVGFGVKRVTDFAAAKGAVGVTAAMFVPGHMGRALSVGGDGRCHVVEFAGEALILQTWDLRARATSLALWPMKAPLNSTKVRAASRGKQKQQEHSQEFEGHALVAVGMNTTTIMLYDEQGIKLHDIGLEGNAPILSLEWVQGKSPPACSSRLRSRSSEENSHEGSATSLVVEDHKLVTGRTRPRRGNGGPKGAECSARATSTAQLDTQGEQTSTIVRKGGNVWPELPVGTRVDDLIDLFDTPRHSSKIRRQGYARNKLKSPRRPWISSSTFVSESDQKPSPERSQDTTSEPDELDPNLTFSYLTSRPEAVAHLGRHHDSDKVFSVAPGYLVSSISTRALIDDFAQEHVHEQRPRKFATRGQPWKVLLGDDGCMRVSSPVPASNSEQRPSRTAYVRRTAETDLRRQDRQTKFRVVETPFDYSEPRGHSPLGSSSDSGGPWADKNGSETERQSRTKRTYAPKTRRWTTAERHGVARKPSPRKTVHVVQASTAYHERPEEPLATHEGTLIESLRPGRRKTNLGSAQQKRFMPERVEDMPRPPGSTEERRPQSGEASGWQSTSTEQDRACRSPEHSHRRRRRKYLLPAHTPGHFPLSTTGTSEEAKESTAASKAVHELYPRSSSLRHSPGRKGKNVAAVPMSRYNASSAGGKQTDTKDLFAAQERRATRRAQTIRAIGDQADGGSQDLLGAIQHAVWSSAATSTQRPSKEEAETKLSPLHREQRQHMSASASDVVGCYASITSVGSGGLDGEGFVEHPQGMQQRDGGGNLSPPPAPAERRCDARDRGQAGAEEEYCASCARLRMSVERWREEVTELRRRLEEHQVVATTTAGSPRL